MSQQFTWENTLKVECLPLSEIRKLKDGGLIPKNGDESLPWVKLLEPLSFISPRCGKVELPKDFIYNGASIPRPARWWMSPEDPRIIRAAAWHDFICGKRGIVVIGEKGKYMTFEDAADELKLGMIADGAKKHDGLIVYGAVVSFGPKW